MKKLGVGALLLAALGLGWACSNSNGNECLAKRVTCAAPLVCDPDDGVCKCGGRGGVVCPDGFNCDPLANTCQSNKCIGVSCGAGTSCDQFDGQCKCGGTGGTICPTGQACDPTTKHCSLAVSCAQVTCGRNQACDPQSGQCLCGNAACPAPKFCSVDSTGNRTCVDDPCNGVVCVGMNLCDPTDGYCKCNGAVCTGGQACVCTVGDGGSCGPTSRACVTSSQCAGVGCDGGTTCDPMDGQCKCGGPGGPVCTAAQICALSVRQCQGSGQCVLPDGGPVTCTGGESCDPEDGVCKCGGRGGTACRAPDAGDPGTICVATPLEEACMQPCNPVSPFCPSGHYCYFDPTAGTPAAYCAVPGGSQVDGQGCNSATACFDTNPTPHALNCTGLAPGVTGICHPYCSVQAGTQGCPQVPQAHVCVQIGQAPMDVGFCNPQ